MVNPNYSTWGDVEKSMVKFLLPYIEKIYLGIQIFNDPVLVAAMARQNKRIYRALYVWQCNIITATATCYSLTNALLLEFWHITILLFCPRSELLTSFLA